MRIVETINKDEIAAQYLADQEITLQNSTYVNWDGVLECCEATVDSHAEINPILVCNDCRHIIKCFEEERAFKNFLSFCHSRGRVVRAAKYDKYYVVVYQSHGNV